MSSNTPSAPILITPKGDSIQLSQTVSNIATHTTTPKPSSHSHHGNSEHESPIVKFLVSGSVALTFELAIGHYLEFLKISKQTSTLSYAQLTRNMIQHKGIIGVLDGFFPWGAIQVTLTLKFTLTRIIFTLIRD